MKGTPAASPHLWRLVVLLALRGFFETYELFMTAFVSPGLVCNGVFHVGEAMAMQDNAKAIFLIRLLGSIAIGTQLITLDVYASEIVPRNIRGRALGLAFALLQSAIPVALPNFAHQTKRPMLYGSLQN